MLCSSFSYDVLYVAALVIDYLHHLEQDPLHWLGLVEHLGGLDVGGGHEPLRHWVQVRHVEPPHPGPPVALVRLYQPELLALLQRDAPLGGSFKGVESLALAEHG